MTKFPLNDPKLDRLLQEFRNTGSERLAALTETEIKIYIDEEMRLVAVEAVDVSTKVIQHLADGIRKIKVRLPKA